MEKDKRIKVAIFYRKKVDTTTEKTIFLEETTYSETPLVGNYVQHGIRQKYLGYKVEAVIYLQPNCENWDIALLVGNANTKITMLDFEEELYRIRNKRRVDEGYKYRNRKKFENPDPPWQRRKDLYNRIQAGESAENIAAEIGIKPSRVRQLVNEWKSLKTTVYLYDQEDKENEQS